VFPGNDLPGVWLGRGASRLAGAHGVRPGRRAVVVAGTEEAAEHAAVLRDAGLDVLLVAPPGLPRNVEGVRTIEGALVAAEGRRGVEAVVIEEARRRRRVRCDALVVSFGLAPRDALVRMAGDEPVVAAGDAAAPGCGLDEAEASGRRAGAGTGPGDASAAEPPAAEPPAAEPPAAEPFDAEGVVCLCEDVEAHDLAVAWAEGWRSSEILKRYTTATMGPCQGAVCGRLLARFVAERRPEPAAGARTTARPPARPVALEALVAGVEETIERRTSLHERHRALGARLDRSGSWIRPYRYGEVREEIRAVRERVGLMDVGTLGKLTIAGPDATALVDRAFPCRVDDLAPGRSRYLLALDEAGYVFDDGLLCALPEGRFFLTSTSGGADRIEAWLRDWADRWELAAHVVPMTSALGAILVGGPAARTLLERLTEHPVDAVALPHMSHADVTVAGVPCRAIRTGFVGELAVELHHPRSRGPELWDALLAAGDDLGCRPFGLDALDVLRLEKGHLYLGQDTLPDDHPGKLGLGFAVAADKPAFVGKVALARMAERPLERTLVGLRFDAPPQRGAPLEADGRIVGRVTSCARSDAVGAHVGLGWLRAVDGAFPRTTRAGDATATVSATPFYDPEGARLRA
jgi:sarcosine oxidase subunit alpha